MRRGIDDRGAVPQDIRRSTGQPHRTFLVALIAVAVVLALSVVYLNRGSEPREEPAVPQAQGTAASFAVVGDSITEARSPDINAGNPGSGSWTFYAVDDATQFVGGWARSGSTTSQMADNTTPLRADCLVILAGTNDIARGIPFDASAANLRAIAERAGLETVIVSAIPPFDPDPQAATAYNAALSELAAAEGWAFADPMEDLRVGDGYKPSMTTDGVHPTDGAARIIGESLRIAIHEAASP